MTQIEDVTAQIAASVDGGRIIELGHPLHQGMPHHAMHPPFLFSLSRQHGDIVNNGYSSANDMFTMGGHTGTHIDALGHVSEEGRIFGGIDAVENQDVRSGLREYDITKVPPLFARGVMLDVAAHAGQDHLEADHGVTAEELQATADAQCVTMQPGDVVLVRTGWTQVFEQDPANYSAPSGPIPPGVTLDGAQWLVERGVRATGADTAPYELRRPGLPVHRFLLVRSGVPIMENLNLEEAARQQAHVFLFVTVPLRIVGGTGSPIRPLAIL